MSKDQPEIVISLRDGFVTVESAPAGATVKIIDEDHSAFDVELNIVQGQRDKAGSQAGQAFFDGFARGMERARFLLEERTPGLRRGPDLTQ